MVTLINNHVLFPHLANYETPPKWQRSWKTELSSSVVGNETRNALRAQPRQQLTFLLTPWTLQEQQELEDRIRQAKKTGFACAPFFGRGSVLAANVTSTAVSFSTVATTCR